MYSKTMSKFAEQKIQFAEKREMEKSSRENLGKFFYDLAKLSFAGLVLASGTTLFSPADDGTQIYRFALGVLSTFVFAISGYKTIKNK